MEPITHLIETVLWIGLIVWLVLRFQPHLEAIVTSVQKRVDSGSTIKAGPLSIEDLRPQPVEDQKKKAQEEIKEALGNDTEGQNQASVRKAA